MVRVRRSSLTLGDPRITSDTRGRETCARSATSCWVGSALVIEYVEAVRQKTSERPALVHEAIRQALQAWPQVYGRLQAHQVLGPDGVDDSDLQLVVVHVRSASLSLPSNIEQVFGMAGQASTSEPERGPPPAPSHEA